MNSSPVVRPAARSDFDRWLTLWDGFSASYGRVGPTALPREITLSTWERFFDAYEPVHALVAEKKGVLIGLVHYLFHRSTTALGPVCYLQDLFTDDASRRKGVGRALIEAVYDRAREAGATQVYWLAHESNHAAMALYDKVAERSGFVVYHKKF